MSLPMTAEGVSYASAYRDIKLNSLVLFLHDGGVVSQCGAAADAVATWSGWWWPLPPDPLAAAAFSHRFASFQSLLSMTHSTSRLYNACTPQCPNQKEKKSDAPAHQHTPPTICIGSCHHQEHVRACAWHLRSMTTERWDTQHGRNAPRAYVQISDLLELLDIWLHAQLGWARIEG